MRAIQLEQPKQFRVIDVPEPPAPGPGDAVVKIHRVGICGTDLSGYLGKMPFFSYPRIPGHELGVEVVAVGPDVTSVKVGDRAAIEPYINCQTCYSCTRGHTNCCENHKTLGVHIDGGLQPLFTIPARKLHVSKTLTFDQLALVETLGIGLHAVNRANPRADETVLVIGAGPIGLSVIEFAKLTGARVVVMDINEQRLRFVREKMGVADTIQAQGFEADRDAFTELTGGKLGNVVVDATGSAKSMMAAYNFVGFAGRLVWVGITQDPLTVTQPLMHRREMTFLASRNAVSPEFTRIVRLIEGGVIDTRPWITHSVPFDAMIGEFPNWLKPETGVVKAIVEVN
ncbi:zinc-type alcohol dehydrogenase : Alcohol dehydrogenase GroES domain protein OS=Pirellula staleyi (strain ATCC 27377 / DSM 6068 / ICPB 4128) GN=Psta_0941 PE=4 SV=1: ADH_N: ADH_zinc_N [Gemmataceae bacterium]|nr:zinc-type alcohol dehydrogenase : Alcohol dehydrogenase GroES domain protein OS=Pirellula staleyi (strain ATCC 27377 / DSM 6068 / ICPB 4128) GN=Psta_0941 PE=4 SV=1: ADH_N: ADH_zinc_N [Gemmataceae bacterium]VTT98032.1 zinc-type alcohol dehydrogenase : Alcohol dehydrogenase GroES domain protein OS=Pirellula staleyi (strain ATCC 27377 / DSM 6068 / ICPB 4128) GN=Psta_0941 PE=4 SV=1: ADH_N: ADH_zinc_N [Gemmataceae bacterium]